MSNGTIPSARELPNLVTVFGGSGFIGRHIVFRLAAAGVRARVAVRDPQTALFLRTMGEVGQIDIVQANLRDDASVSAALAGADAAVTSVGLLSEWGKQTFDAIHDEAAARVARLAKASGVRGLIHISALGADENSPSRYGRSKWAGEVSVRAEFADTVILRPSIVFGPEDGFFNLFGRLASASPVLPVFARTLFDRDGVSLQPVYVGDVADAAVRALADPAHAGQTFELGGPQIFTWRQLMELICADTRRNRLIVPVLASLAKVAAFFLEIWPAPLLTRDQVRQLEVDNVVAEGALGLADLGVTPTPAGAITPGYLFRFIKPGRNTGIQMN